MGYHTGSDIPNYWAYANNFVLQDHMFEPNASWSLPAHLFTVSEWAAYCTQEDNPSSCVNGTQSNPPAEPQVAPAIYGGQAGPKKLKNQKKNPGNQPIYAWTDLTYLLHKNHVNWGYYVVSGTEPDCENDAAVTCAPVRQNANTPGIWNPLPWFDTVKADHQLGEHSGRHELLQAGEERELAVGVLGGALESVSEHPPTR